jgi:Single-strand binding protein family
MTIIGRLTKDAIVKTIKEDKKVESFSIVINDGYKDKKTDSGYQYHHFITVANHINHLSSCFCLLVSKVQYPLKYLGRTRNTKTIQTYNTNTNLSFLE